MCRWITLISADPISLSDVVLAPSHALVHQSRDATYHPGYNEINNTSLNADGFGVGWYHSNIATIPVVVPKIAGDGTVQTAAPATTTAPPPPKPKVDPDTFRAAAVFKDVFPAWNNMNLRELCMSTSSSCIMAHVRAASPGTGISHNNCHPFKAGRLLFCHNGRIFSYQQVKRRFLAVLSDEVFLNIKGTTDSECFFGLILTHLEKDGKGSPIHQTTPFGHQRLVSAMQKALKQMELLLAEAGVSGYSTCNFSLTDGETMVVTRYCDVKQIPPPSLYFTFGNAATLHKELTTEQPLNGPLFAQESSSSSPSSANGAGARVGFSEEKKTDSSSEGEGEESDSGDDSEEGITNSDGTFREHTVMLQAHESLPGKVMEQIDPTTATFIVSSNPLTYTHRWHKMPRNSIMWCTRGSHPELRLLKTTAPTAIKK